MLNNEKTRIINKAISIHACINISDTGIDTVCLISFYAEVSHHSCAMLILTMQKKNKKKQEPFQNISTFCDVRKRENISKAVLNFVPLRAFLAKYRETRMLECRRESGLMTLVTLVFTTHRSSHFLEYSATVEEKQVNDVYLSVAFPCFGLVSWKYR